VYAIVLLSIKFNTTMKEGSERVRRDLGHARTHAHWETSTPVLDELIFSQEKSRFLCRWRQKGAKRELFWI
jgi:hypothetical protein